MLQQWNDGAKIFQKISDKTQDVNSCTSGAQVSEPKVENSGMAQGVGCMSRVGCRV